MSKFEVKEVKMFEDVAGNLHDNVSDCKDFNHKVHLAIRELIGNNIVTFSDGRVDNLSTTAKLFGILGFSKEFIKEVSKDLDMNRYKVR